MKRIKTLVILLVILSIIVGFGALLKPNQDAFSNVRPSTTDKVLKSLEKWIQEMESPFYKDISVKPVLIESNIQPDSLSYAIFNVNVKQVLKAQSPEELPMIKGMINCLNSKKPSLKQPQIDYANRELEDQLKELRVYINRTEELNAIFKVEFIVDTNYNIKPDSIKFYVETPDRNTFLDADILQPGTPEGLEKRGFKRMEEIIEQSKQNRLLTTCSFHNAYDRIAAGDYANRYTSECQSGGKNTNYWNNNEYKLSVHFAYDCADYVS